MNYVSRRLNASSPKCSRLSLVDAPRWGTMKQSSQTWNSLASYFLCRPQTFRENFMKIRSLVFPWYYQQSQIQNIKKSTLDSRGWLQHPENVPDCSLSHVQPLLKISWKSFHSFSRYVANSHGFPRTCWKRFPVFKGLNRTSRKCSRLFLVISPTGPENFMTNRLRVFPWCC